jgi:hypothetical protein
MGMILRIASSRIVGQGDIVGRSGYFSLNLSANSVMRGRLDARRTLKSLVADLRNDNNFYHFHYSEIPEGYYRHDMVGMYYRGITPENFGVYEGYAIAQKNNQYDPYAIAIYRSWDNKHVGYLPAGNAELHRILTYRGGKANAIFRIQGSRKRCYGDVYIEEKYRKFGISQINILIFNMLPTIKSSTVKL